MTQRNACQERRLESSQGFTRLELLFVVLTVGLVLVVLLPALASTHQQDKAAVCSSNLRQIGVGMLTYTADNDDYLYAHSNGGIGFSIPNGGQWFKNPRSTTMLSADDPSAYWGVAYYDYVGRTREVFRCPSARIVDEWRESGLSYPSEFWLTSTYGLYDGLVTAANGVRRNLESYASPATTILTQDSAEQRTEGSSDTLGLFPGATRILSQWVDVIGPQVYNNYPFEWEWYRHDRKCNTLWLSGNVSKIPFTGYNVGIDYRYYTGEPIVTPIP
jgi:type II secretory pathway pseudopilin PulG